MWIQIEKYLCYSFFLRFSENESTDLGVIEFVFKINLKLLIFLKKKIKKDTKYLSRSRRLTVGLPERTRKYARVDFKNVQLTGFLMRGRVLFFSPAPLVNL